MPLLRPLPAFEDNYIWLQYAPDGSALVVDPGDAAVVLREVEAGLHLRAVLITHHHADHIGGLMELQSRLGLPCYGPQDDRIPDVLSRVGGGDRIQPPEWPWPIEVLAVPGHTRSHIAFLSAGALFCGDTLFSLGCGRLFEGSPAQMLDSLDRLNTLPADTLVCCTHEYTLANARFALEAEPGNPALRARIAEVEARRAAGLASLPVALQRERDCNPFLRVRQPGVLATLQARRGLAAGADPVAAFAALRGWKDEFRG
ncbi:MAG: hydroxyacylglutathione hydrolase [Aquimonas sp.]|nr:hydroxyacylglutathione hydrolase [Aquimonas sp.]